MISYNLIGRAAIVTGGASGIGLATVTLLARAGAAVALNFLPGDARGKHAVAQLKANGANTIEADAGANRRTSRR
jgi:3-oxoacyl-[acyl-carrier protein] reductase